MKTYSKIAAALFLSLAPCASPVFAQLAIPSDGSDGALVVNSDTVIDLSQAVTGNWNDNNAANAGKGIYDPAKWAVVFKYSSVNISSGTSVTFANHSSRAPVVWLVSGDVTINGNIILDGHYTSLNYTDTGEPGPGGFRGGTRAMSGFGPGGGYSGYGYYSNPTYGYGNPQIVPLIGGSGGNAYNVSEGGAGAILIASSGTITINGTVSARPGYGASSGGAIRLIAGQLTGNGNIYVNASDPGRIRLEATNAPGINLNITGVANPLAFIVSPFPLTIWPATNAPIVQVTTISNVNANLTVPADPKASLAAGQDDLTLATTNAVTITLQTFNYPTNGTVNVYIKSLSAGQTVLPASFVSGNNDSAMWQLTTVLPVNHTVIQARAVPN